MNGQRGAQNRTGAWKTSACFFLLLTLCVDSVVPARIGRADPSPTPLASPSPQVPSLDTGLPDTSGAADAFKTIDLPPPATPSEKQKKELGKIPLKPAAPEELEKPNPGEIFTCERFFSYRGRKLVCDSFVREDAERLRPVIADVPAALNELDRYQANRRKIRNTAFVGSFGILALGFGNFFMKNGPGKRAVMLAGTGILVGSFLYSFTLLRSNEAHLGNAVHYYNNAHPESPIELQFSAGFTF